MGQDKDDFIFKEARPKRKRTIPHSCGGVDIKYQKTILMLDTQKLKELRLFKDQWKYWHEQRNTKG